MTPRRFVSVAGCPVLRRRAAPPAQLRRACTNTRAIRAAVAPRTQPGAAACTACRARCPSNHSTFIRVADVARENEQRAALDRILADALARQPAISRSKPSRMSTGSVHTKMRTPTGITTRASHRNREQPAQGFPVERARTRAAVLAATRYRTDRQPPGRWRPRSRQRHGRRRSTTSSPKRTPTPPPPRPSAATSTKRIALDPYRCERLVELGGAASLELIDQLRPELAPATTTFGLGKPELAAQRPPYATV